MFSKEEIPEGAEVFNINLYLLKCKSNYELKDGTCILKCYENCETCSEYSENINSQKCLTCKSGYLLDNNNCIFSPTTIIISTFPRAITTTIPTTLKSNIQTRIPTTIPNILITNIQNRIPTTIPNEIIKTKQTTKNTNIYYKEISDVKIELTDNKKDEFCSVEKILNGTCIEGKMILSDIDIIKKYLTKTQDGDADSAMRTLKTGNVIIQFSSLDEQKDNDDKEVSNIDLGGCEQKLKAEYNISENVSLLIYKTDVKNSDLTSTYVQYEVYDPFTMNPLNLSICNEMKVTINIPVDIGNKMEELYDSLSDSGYNLFNSNDSFYQDICTTYTTINGTDMLLSDRKKDIYSLSEDVSMCQTGCILESYNSQTKKAKCNCNIEETSSSIMDLDIDSVFNKDKIKNSFYDTLSNSNFRVLSCYKSVFSSELLKNIGELFMSAITFLFLGFNVFSFIIYEQRIKSYISKIKNIKGEIIDTNTDKKIKSNINENNNNQENKKKKGKKKKKKKKKKQKNASVTQFPPKKGKNNDNDNKMESLGKDVIDVRNSKSVNNKINSNNDINVYESVAKESMVTEKNFIENREENNNKENIENIKIENLNDQEIND